MIFGIAILLLVLAIAYFHYAQGFFSATISAICTIVAAIVAVSYHETVINLLLKGAVANYAEAMVLCGLFALTYIILRVIADKAVPGNVLFPLMVDKIGAGVMGIVAGLFGTGVFVMAVQSMPFGPSIAGYARFTVVDREVNFPGPGGRSQDSITDSEMKDPSFDPAKVKGILVPVDDMVVSVVGNLSTGALSNDHPLAAIHPDWPTELFGERTGVQTGTKRVLLNLPGLQMVNLQDVFKMDSVFEIDAEFHSVREGVNRDLQPLVPEKGDTLKAAADQTLLVVRVSFGTDAGDEDNKVRVSCGAVHLVGWKDQGGTRAYTDYNPLGTLENANVLFRNKPDDPIVLQSGKSADFVFQVNRDDVFKDPNPKTKEADIKNGVFVGVKRMAQLDLSGRTVKGPPNLSKDVEVIRKPLPQAEHLPKRGENGDLQASVETVAGPLDVTDITVNDKLFAAVNPGMYQGDQSNITFRSGVASMRQKKFAKLTVNPTDAVKMLGMGDNATTDLFVPDGKKMVQVVAKTPAKGDAWAWADLNSFELLDASGTKYKPNGALAELKQTGQNKMVANYDADTPVQSVNKEDGRPGQVFMIFNVPTGTQITQILYQGKPIFAKNVTVQ
ncbi:MAG TPA: CvpA family protein [Tepidisphaeraceae bacterium]|jgi:hypothetical protein|nr:CvpA family protein [Tepidisphaeraceae bacterium]